MGTFWNLQASDVVTLLLTIVMIWAVIKAPKWAVDAQWELQRRKEDRDRRMWIYRTLMATRERPVDFRHVEALNMIDVEFSTTSPEDKATRSAWKDYLDALYDKADFDSQQKLERRRDLLAELLQRMGKALGYDFSVDYLKRRAYYPQGHGEEAADLYRTRKGWLDILDGKKALNMDIIQTEDAAKRAAEMSSAWLDIAQGKKALKMELSGPVPSAIPPVIKVTERIQECRSPRIAAACGFRCFRNPQRFSGLELIAKARIECLDSVHSGEPLLRERRAGSYCCRLTHRRAPFRDRSVRMVREDIEHGSSRLQQVLRLQHSRGRRR